MSIVDIEGRWDPFVTAPRLVEERFDNGWLAALGAYQTTMENILRLQNIASDLRLINRSIEIDTTTISTGELTVEPPILDTNLLTVYAPDMPTDPQIIEATIDTFPNYPDLVVGDIPVPNETYTTDLLTALKTKFLADVQSGGTGISPAVEDAIFKREYERSILIHNDAMDELAATVARGGYIIPGGTLRAAQDKEIATFTNKRLDVSRDVAIKSFELAFQHTQFILQQGVAFESHLMDWAHNVAALATQVATAIVDAQVRVFTARTDGISKKIMGIIEKLKARIAYNGGLIEIFSQKVNAYSAKLRGEGDRVNAVARGFEAQVGLFRGIADFDIQKMGLDLKVLDTRMSQAIANANIIIKDKELEAKNYEVLNSLKIEAMKAAGSIAAQLVAGAMAGVSASASISASNTSTYTPKWTWSQTGGLLGTWTWG